RISLSPYANRSAVPGSPAALPGPNIKTGFYSKVLLTGTPWQLLYIRARRVVKQMEGSFLSELPHEAALACVKGTGACRCSTTMCRRVGSSSQFGCAQPVSERTLNGHPRAIETRHGAACVLVVRPEIILHEIQGDLLAQ